jgi:hypothetical protein
MRWARGDPSIVRRYAGYGYEVVQESYKIRFPRPEDADGFDCVMASSSMSSQIIGSFFKSVPVPVIIFEVYACDDMAMVQPSVVDSATGETSVDYTDDYEPHSTQITIVNESHPMAGGLSGSFPFCTEPDKIQWIRPPSTATKIAVLEDDTNEVFLCGYDTGDTLYDGTVAAARRVAFGLGDYNADHMTDEGWQLFDAVVWWALGKEAVDEDSAGQEEQPQDTVVSEEPPSDSLDTPGQNDNCGSCGNGVGLAFFPLCISAGLQYRNRKKRRNAYK